MHFAACMCGGDVTHSFVDTKGLCVVGQGPGCVPLGGQQQPDTLQRLCRVGVKITQAHAARVETLSCVRFGLLQLPQHHLHRAQCMDGPARQESTVSKRNVGPDRDALASAVMAALEGGSTDRSATLSQGDEARAQRHE